MFLIARRIVVEELEKCAAKGDVEEMKKIALWLYDMGDQKVVPWPTGVLSHCGNPSMRRALGGSA